MKSIAIFCGSSSGFDKNYTIQAFNAGKTLAQKGIRIVYGGAKIGVMGAIADGALSENGEVIGVLPHFLNAKELAHPNLTQLISTDTMHSRKMLMDEMTDGVIALPGGFGTMDELFEMLTWGQLGLHKKPVGILNINGFYDSLFKMMQIMVDEGFVKNINLNMVLIDDNLDSLLHQMQNYIAPEVPKWINKHHI